MIFNSTVSILIPCYNAEQWIADAIDSALAQTYPHTEVVVYDDGSTDDSLDIITSYGEQIRWGTGPNRGGGPARNWLLEVAEGAWIQYLDADDYLKPGKVANQIRALQEIEPPVDVLYGPVTFQRHIEERVEQYMEPVEYPDDPWASLVTWDLPQTGSPIWRKEALLDVGGWKEDQPVCQEHELYLRLLVAGKQFQYVPVNGAVYRKWSSETVCEADQARTRRYQHEIMRRAETFMAEQGIMTDKRRSILNNAYLQCSRMIWLFDPVWAQEIMQHVEAQTEGDFRPAHETVTRIYRYAYQLLGFNAAEHLAAAKRNLH